MIVMLLVLQILSFAIVARLFPLRHRFFVLKALLVPCFLVALKWGWDHPSFAVSGLGIAFFFYAVFFLLSLSFYSMVDHSVRVRVAVELFLGRRISNGDEAAIRRRMGKLQHAGIVVADAHSFTLTKRGKGVASVVRLGRRLFAIPMKGFETQYEM